MRVTGTPQLALTIGADTKQAACSVGCDGSTTSELRFSYRIQEEDSDEDGISIPANALSLPPRSSITDADGNALNAMLTHDAVPADSDHKVDGSQMTIPTGVRSLSPAHRPAAIPMKEARRSKRRLTSPPRCA